MLGILSHSLRTATRNAPSLDPDELLARELRARRREWELEAMRQTYFLGRRDTDQTSASKAACRAV